MRLLDVRVAAIRTVPLGVCLAIAGCGAAEPGDIYQTFSPEDARQVEQAREARAGESAVDGGVAAAPAEPVESAALLSAAQTAARIARADRATAAEAPSGGRQSPEASPAADGSVGAGSAAVGERQSGGSETSLADVAGARAADLIDRQPPARQIQLLVPDRSFTVEGPGEAIRISYDDFDLLKVLNMDPVPVDAGEHFPKWLAALDGRRIRVRGFMYPTFQETGLSKFVLARDNQICCFGRNPKIYDLVEVTLADGVTTDYIQGRPFDVVGTFRIRPEADADELWQLYQIENAIVVDD